jgi:hypothetical protein
MWIDVRQRRLLFSVDMSSYGRHDDRSQAVAQRYLSTILDRVGRKVGLHRTLWMRQDAGDGELAILPDWESEAALVDPFVHELSMALTDHNLERNEAHRLRMRMAVHHGVAYRADLGYAGKGIVEVSRLLNSSLLRRVLRKAPVADLVLALTRPVFEDTIVQRATSLSAGQFREVRVREKEYAGSTWLFVPGIDVHELDLSPDDDDASPDGGTSNGNGEPRTGAVNEQSIGGAVGSRGRPAEPVSRPSAQDRQLERPEPSPTSEPRSGPTPSRNRRRRPPGGHRAPRRRQA